MSREGSMRSVTHRDALESCPHLPQVEGPVTAAAMRRFGKDRGPAFYAGALVCAQSLWLQGLPAQAILQLNRAFSADLRGDERELEHWPLPYAAMGWILAHRTGDQFLGNPRRHFQHLATRMVEPRKELRTWRAWACWHLSRLILPGIPGDERQILEEGVREPEEKGIWNQLRQWGLPGEQFVWEAACREAEISPLRWTGD